jgi:hypothetical protein
VQEVLNAVHCVVVAAQNAAPVFLFAAAVEDGTALRFFLAVRADVFRWDLVVKSALLFVLVDHPYLAEPVEPPGRLLHRQATWQEHPKVFVRAAVSLLGCWQDSRATPVLALFDSDERNAHLDSRCDRHNDFRYPCCRLHRLAREQVGPAASRHRSDAIRAQPTWYCPRA